MPRGPREKIPGAFYHVMSRGNEKQTIYGCVGDKEKFLHYLKKGSRNHGALIHCYCMMENHFHLLVETPYGNISQVMHSINSSYSKYFNSKWNRVGHLFQGRYKSKVIETDSYLLELSRYIHLNPVKAGLVQRPESYRWSSYHSYLGNDDGFDFVQQKFILSLVGSEEPQSYSLYRAFVEDKIGKEYTVSLFENN